MSAKAEPLLAENSRRIEERVSGSEVLVSLVHPLMNLAGNYVDQAKSRPR